MYRKQTVESTAESATQQRIALVTDADRRMGRVVALALARHSWDVAVHCHRSRTEADAVAAGIAVMGRHAVVLQANPSDEAAAGRLIVDYSAALDMPTYLVNNASLFQYDVTTSFSYTSLDAHMRTDVAAPLLLSRELHRTLTAGDAEHRGVVVSLLDRKPNNLNLDFLSYTLSKAALSTATVQLTQALMPALRAVGMAPGITMVSGDQSQGGFARAHQMAPLGQSSTPGGIAEAVCYLTTAYVVAGAALFVGGGQHLMPLAHDVIFPTE